MQIALLHQHQDLMNLSLLHLLIMLIKTSLQSYSWRILHHLLMLQKHSHQYHDAPHHKCRHKCQKRYLCITYFQYHLFLLNTNHNQRQSPNQFLLWYLFDLYSWYHLQDMVPPHLLLKDNQHHQYLNIKHRRRHYQILRLNHLT